MKKGLVLAVLLLLAAAVAGYWLTATPPGAAPEPNAAPAGDTPPTPSAPATPDDAGNAPEPNAETSGTAGQPAPDRSEQTARNEAEAQSEPAAPTPPKDFCERDFADVEARSADADALAAAGGLVHIFEREAQLADPYGCADFYLDHGLDIDAVDPRDDHDPLTGLFFAIQRNDPKMVNFMIDHGADLDKRAGKKDTKALGYAYFLALQDQRIDRNEVIGILDSALTAQSAAGQSGDNDRP